MKYIKWLFDEDTLVMAGFSLAVVSVIGICLIYPKLFWFFLVGVCFVMLAKCFK